LAYLAYLHWNYILVLEIETPCIIAVIGVQAGGGGGTRITIFLAISFHFLGTDNDKIKIVGGNIIGKKLFICGKNIIVNINIFGKSVKY
jgi:hypothetical protein